jgi:hypothetical protein
MFSYLKQSTASQTRIVGPFIDDTDFKTLETALTIANTYVKLSKNGAASVNKNSGGGTHIVNGNYAFTFDGTDTNTVGELHVSVAATGALVVVTKFVVLEEAIYDALFAASAAAFDANQDVTVGSIAAGAITAAAIATDAIDADAIAVNAIDNSALAAGAVTEIANGVWDTATVGHTTAGTFGEQLATDVDAILVDTGTTLQGELDGIQADTEDIQAKIGTPAVTLADDIAAIDAGGGATAAEVADAVWDEATAGHTTAGTFGEQAKTDIDAVLADTEDIQSRLSAALVGGRIDATLDATGMETGAIDAILTRQLTEDYNADGVAPTLAQALFVIMQYLTEMSISGTTTTRRILLPRRGPADGRQEHHR